MNIVNVITPFSIFLDDAGAIDVEAVHQKILGYLFNSKTIVETFFGFNLVKIEVVIEAEEKTFDIQIKGYTNVEYIIINIELKMWSSLIDEQLKKQVRISGGNKLFYLLLGACAWEWEEKRLKQEKYKDLRENVEFLRPRDITIKLLKLRDKIPEIAKELGCDIQAIEQLLCIYAYNIEKRLRWLENNALEEKFLKTNKVAHYFSFFQKLRKELEGKFSTWLYRSGKSSVHLEVWSDEEGDRRVQLNGVSGELMFWLKDRSLQIFFKRDDKFRTSIGSNTVLDIRSIFRSVLARQAKSFDLDFLGNKLKATKRFPEYLSLISVSYRSTSRTSSFKDIANFVEKWHKLFIWACKEFEEND